MCPAARGRGEKSEMAIAVSIRDPRVGHPHLQPGIRQLRGPGDVPTAQGAGKEACCQLGSNMEGVGSSGFCAPPDAAPPRHSVPLDVGTVGTVKWCGNSPAGSRFLPAPVASRGWMHRQLDHSLGSRV